MTEPTKTVLTPTPKPVVKLPPKFDWGTYNPSTLPRVESPPPTTAELAAMRPALVTRLAEAQKALAQHDAIAARTG